MGQTSTSGVCHCYVKQILGIGVSIHATLGETLTCPQCTPCRLIIYLLQYQPQMIFHNALIIGNVRNLNQSTFSVFVITYKQA